MDILILVWEFLQTGTGMMVSGFIILFMLNKIFDAKPSWKKYEGFMIAAIKQAEKWVPDGTGNKGLQKADKALKYFIESYEKAKGKTPSRKLLSDVQNGMPIVHHKIDGILKHLDSMKKS